MFPLGGVRSILRSSHQVSSLEILFWGVQNNWSVNCSRDLVVSQLLRCKCPKSLFKVMVVSTHSFMVIFWLSGTMSAGGNRFEKWMDGQTVLNLLVQPNSIRWTFGISCCCYCCLHWVQLVSPRRVDFTLNHFQGSSVFYSPTSTLRHFWMGVAHGAAAAAAAHSAPAELNTRLKSGWIFNQLISPL